MDCLLGNMYWKDLWICGKHFLESDCLNLDENVGIWSLPGLVLFVQLRMLKARNPINIFYHFFVSWKVGTNSSEIQQTMELLTTSIKVFFCTSSICELMDFGRFRSEMCAKHQVMYCISFALKADGVSGLWGQELLFMAMSLDCVDFVESNSTNLYLMPERSWLKMKLLKLLHLSGGWFLGFTCSETFGFRRGLGWRSAYGPLDTTHARWGFPGKNGWTHFW